MNLIGHGTKNPALHIIANVFADSRVTHSDDKIFNLIKGPQIDYNLIDASHLKNYQKFLAAGYQTHGISAYVNDFFPTHFYKIGIDKGPDWRALAQQIQQAYPYASLPLMFPGTETIEGRADIGPFEQGQQNGDNAIGVDPALCGVQQLNRDS